MAILFFDTETTDLLSKPEIPGPHQPHVVQLAALLVDGESETELCTLIRPDGWTVAKGAERVHGVSTERALAEGVALKEAIGAFHVMAERAELLAAHNLDFDLLLILSEYARLEMPDSLSAKRKFCTMKESTDILKLPGKRGYKWPTLQEAYLHFTGTAMSHAHDALVDVKACRAVYEGIASATT